MLHIRYVLIKTSYLFAYLCSLFILSYTTVHLHHFLYAALHCKDRKYSGQKQEQRNEIEVATCNYFNNVVHVQKPKEVK